MTLNDMKKPLVAFAVASAALMGTSAQAYTVTRTYTLDVAGILSNDEKGSDINEVRWLNVGAGSKVIGFGWDVLLWADEGSWLSEIGVDISSIAGDGLDLQPGLGDDFSGVFAYSSGGLVDLLAEGLEFMVGADGQLRFEFYDAFDDYPGEWDGRWNAGLLTIQVEAIPEPATYGLAALALLGIGATARRRNGKA